MPDTPQRAWRRWLVTFSILLLSMPGLDGINTPSRIIFHSVSTVLLGAWLVSLLIQGRGLPATRLDRPLGLFLLAAAMSTAFAVDPRTSLEGLWRFAFDVLFFYFAVDWMRRYGSRMLIEPFLFIAALMLVLDSTYLVLWYFGWPEFILPVAGWFEVGGLAQPLPPRLPRLFGILTNNPNRLAGYLAALVPVIIAWALTMRTRLTRAALLAIAAGSVLSVGLTFSRGGFLSLAVSLPTLTILLLFGLPGLRAKAVQTARDWRAVAGGAALLAAGVPIFIRWASVREWRIDAARLDIWRSAWLAGLDRPLTGLGPDAFGRARRLFGDPWAALEHIDHAHNAVLSAWAEGGLLGVTALAILISGLVTAAIAHWRRSQGADRIRLVGVLAGLAGYAAHSLFDLIFSAAPHGTAQMFVVVTLAAYVAMPLDPPTRPERSRRPALAPALALALLALAAGGWAVSTTAQRRLDRSVELAGEGRLTEALGTIREAERLDPHMRLYAAQEAQYLGELAAQDAAYLPAALQAFETALHDEGTSDVMHANYAALLASAGDHEAAQRQFEAAAAVKRYAGQYPLWSGVHAERLGNRDVALAAYLDALEREPAWISSGFWELSDVRREARAEFLTVYGLDAIPLSALAALPPICWPTDVPTLWYGWGSPSPAQDLSCEGQRALVLHGDAPQAVELLSRAIDLEPGMTDAYTARAQARLALGERPEATYDLEVAHFYGERRASLILGALAEESGDLESAEAYYRAALPRSEEVQHWSYAVYRRVGLIRYLPPLKMPASVSTEPYLALLRLYEAQGRSDDADAIRAELQAVDPFWQPAGVATGASD